MHIATHARTYNHTEAAAASPEVPYGSFDVVISSSKEDEALAQFIKGATPYMYLIICVLLVARQSCRGLPLALEPPSRYSVWSVRIVDVPPSHMHNSQPLVASQATPDYLVA